MNASTQQVRRAALLVLLCLAALCGKQTLLAFQPKPALRANTHSQIQHRQQLFPYVHSKPYGRANNKVYPGRADKYVLRAFPDPAIMPTFLEAITFNGVGAIGLALAKQKVLTPAGLVNAGILGLGLWTFLGKEGWLFCVMYLVLGSAVTKIRMKEKEALGIAEKRGGARGPENLWGSAATGMVCALLTYIFPAMRASLQVGYVASISTKLSDTFASEIGKAYGKTTYLITTLKPVPRGTEGAVSLEGTLAGVGGSILMAGVGVLTNQISSTAGFASCLVAAFVATTAESYIGAVFQDDIPWLTNEFVNFINTVIGAVVGIGLYVVLEQMI